jgi:hypothetical protein
MKRNRIATVGLALLLLAVDFPVIDRVAQRA